MNTGLRRLVHDRLNTYAPDHDDSGTLVLAACEGRAAVETCLADATTVIAAPASATSQHAGGAFLTSITVEGFRGIGPRRTLHFNPGPGLTIVAGRNGSGKSSFAEALEVLLTGDSRRWSQRSKIWKDGWRSLHQPHPAKLEAELLLEGQGVTTVACEWDDGAALETTKAFVQPKSKPKTTLDALGWKDALVSYRPFLSYNELGSMLDEGPSKLYDALSLVLGLEDLVEAQAVLAESRIDRQKRVTSAKQGRDALLAMLNTLQSVEPDARVKACIDALGARSWGIETVAALLADDRPAAQQDTSSLGRAALLDTIDADRVAAASANLRDAHQQLNDVAGTDADTSRKLANLLEAALAFHAAHGDGDCPVCGTHDRLTPTWSEASRNEVARLRDVAKSSDDAHRRAASALQSARALLTSPPAFLPQLRDAGVTEADAARAQWDHWHSGHAITDANTLADHLESSYTPFADAVSNLKAAAAAELKRREDRWRPAAVALAQWIEPARGAQSGTDEITRIKAAEEWLRDASADIRDDRFAPIADRAMKTWEHLRQQSNVTLGRISLAGAKTTRHVALDVTVDGKAGAALGVMSQGELHSLALSLFLPRATLADSPFRFVVIDDPVQSMDPARVDGLARALEDIARTRQVIVFTHDERLPEAVRRLGIRSTLRRITRRPGSVVDVSDAHDPVRAHIEDALALAHTADLPKQVLQRVVPGFCRAALEAAFINVIRRRRLTAGIPHDAIDDELKAAGKLTTMAALALFDDKERAGDVMTRLNKMGSWAGDVFKQVNQGAHVGMTGDVQQVIRNTEDLTVEIAKLK